jgi:hypothetical protein
VRSTFLETMPLSTAVLVGLVMVDGWPVVHHVFNSNWRDARTVPKVLNELEQRFGPKRVVFVSRRGRGGRASDSRTSQDVGMKWQVSNVWGPRN